MAGSFYFYDLETSGFNPRDARIMQFAGQRTDMQLQPIGDPHNILVRMTEEIVPEPDAILITGITPQKTIADGIAEADFLRIFHAEISVPGTIFVGYNTIRFDDEFMRYLQYRNFYDPYEWQWQDGRSRWDLLDVIRMTRALRPSGIEWPFASDGKPSNRLELLTKVNNIEHGDAHDALSDVRATIGLAQLLFSKQPKLFDFLLRMRDKKQVAKLVNGGEPFVYTSGKYASEYEKTTVVSTIAEHPKRGALAYDLRYDPLPFSTLSPRELADAWTRWGDQPGLRLPVKTIQFNRCPAIAPLSVLDTESIARLQITMPQIKKNLATLQQVNLAQPLLDALEILDKKRQTQFIVDESDVDARLYEGFIGGGDKTVMSALRATNPSEMLADNFNFQDNRLTALLPLYKARNFPKALSSEERHAWEQFCERRLVAGNDKSRLSKYFARLGELAEKAGLTDEDRYLLEELQLYGQSILPEIN